MVVIVVVVVAAIVVVVLVIEVVTVLSDSILLVGWIFRFTLVQAVERKGGGHWFQLVWRNSIFPPNGSTKGGLAEAADQT